MYQKHAAARNSETMLKKIPRLTPGLHELSAHDGQRYYVYMSPRASGRPEEARLLVSVHGYSGRKNDTKGRARARRYAECWARFADEEGLVVLAPHFDERRFNNDYQRLNLGGLRADIRLQELVREVRSRLPGMAVERFLLFGFSGGGQFVHRFVAFHPETVSRAVVGAPGWYMWPKRLPYPLGVRLEGVPDRGGRLLAALCAANVLVVVGKKDGPQGAFRTRFHEHDLVKMQGKGRKERALNWVAAMYGWAEENGCVFNISCMIVTKVAHSLNNKILELAGSHLCGSVVHGVKPMG